MEKTIKTCKVCPVACSLTIEKDPSEETGYRVTGNNCGRGWDFAIKEMTNPSRVLTGRVLLKGGNMSRVTVKTTGPVPSDKIDSCLEIFNKTTVNAPVKKGQLVIEDLLGLGVDVVTMRKA